MLSNSMIIAIPEESPSLVTELGSRTKTLPPYSDMMGPDIALNF